MEKHKPLIPYKLQNHVKVILEGKQGLFEDVKKVILEDDIVWNIELMHAQEKCRLRDINKLWWFCIF
jgi:hypothetical protein